MRGMFGVDSGRPCTLQGLRGSSQGLRNSSRRDRSIIAPDGVRRGRGPQRQVFVAGVAERTQSGESARKKFLRPGGADRIIATNYGSFRRAPGHAGRPGRRGMWGDGFPGFHPGLFSLAPSGSEKGRGLGSCDPTLRKMHEGWGTRQL